jgi:hypothetical protein
MIADLKLAHHYPLALIKDPETWTESHIMAAEKWDGRMPNAPEVEVDWKLRARRAEGEAAAARLLSSTKMYEIQALIDAHERDFTAATRSMSWRITKPLRQLSALFKGARRLWS